MGKVLSCAAVAVVMLLAWSADGATAVQKAPPKKSAAKKKASPAKKPATASASKKGAGTVAAHKPATTTKSASVRGKKAPVKRGVSWRNRQTAPSPDRYREIQGALAAKGFLPPEEATGTWNQTSADALKKFQAEQNLESSGKINSLSLIALGLGPRRDITPAPAPKSTPPQVPAVPAVPAGQEH